MQFDFSFIYLESVQNQVLTPIYLQKILKIDSTPIFIVKNSNPSELEELRKKLKNVSGIYGWINLNNFKVYIGSAQDLSIRPFRHWYPSGNKNPHLWNAFKKYGRLRICFNYF